MRVNNPDDRAEMPEECDNCGSSVKLKRFSHYGPGHQVEWLCRYCANITGKGSDIVHSIAAMFNELEKALQEKAHFQHEQEASAENS